MSVEVAVVPDPDVVSVPLMLKPVAEYETVVPVCVHDDELAITMVILPTTVCAAVTAWAEVTALGPLRLAAVHPVMTSKIDTATTRNESRTTNFSEDILCLLRLCMLLIIELILL